MRRMDLNDVEASPNRTFRSLDEAGDDPSDAVFRQLFRNGVALAVRERTGADDVLRPSALVFLRDGAGVDEDGDGGRLATRVRELDADLLALRVRKLDDLRPGLGLLVVPDPGVLRTDASFGEDSGRLDY